MNNLDAIIHQSQASREYFDLISELLTEVDEPTATMIELGDYLASLQTLFQRIEAYARNERLCLIINS